MAKTWASILLHFTPIWIAYKKIRGRLRKFTFGRFGREGCVEVECLVRDDGGLEGRRDALGQQRLPRDGGEERVPLHALNAVGACNREMKLYCNCAQEQEAGMQGDT